MANTVGMKNILRISERHVRCFSSSSSSSSQVLSTAPVVSWSGARQLNLADNGEQELSLSGLHTLRTRLSSYLDNPTVAVVAFSANGSPALSSQLPLTPDTLGTVNKFSEALLTYPKQNLVLFENQIRSSALGVFSQAKFRLGNDSTTLVLDDFAQGRLPIGGGLSSLLVGTKREGVALARYVVTTQATLTASDMHKLGYLTHVVPNTALDILMPTIADVAANDQTKNYQPRTDSADSVAELLDAMHFGTDDLGRIFLNPVWSKVSIVPPSQYLEDNCNTQIDEGIDSIREIVVHCFNQDDPAECMKRLEVVASDKTHANRDWAEKTLNTLQSTDMQLMKTWFKFTKHVVKKPATAVMNLEEQLVASMKQ